MKVRKGGRAGKKGGHTLSVSMRISRLGTTGLRIIPQIQCVLCAFSFANFASQLANFKS